MDTFNYLCPTSFHTGFEDREEGNQKSSLMGAESEESFKEKLISSIKCHSVDTRQ